MKAIGLGGVRLLSVWLVPVSLKSFLELVLEDDDPADGFHGDALIDHLPGPCGETQVVTRVAAVASGRPGRV